MDKTKKSFKNFIPSKRRLIQLYAALLYNAHLKGYITGNIYTGALKNVCVPGFNCYSCPGAIGACPLGALQNAIAASGAKTPYYMLGILLLYGITFGRTICGFLCPVGLMQELLYKIPTVKLAKNMFTRVLSYLKYVILAVFVVIVPFWYSLQRYPVPAFCKYICPEGTFGGALGLLANPVNHDKFSMLGILFTRKFIILIIIVGICIFVYRAFCRFICPLGAIYGLFARVCVIGIKVDDQKCIDCGRCVRECPMDIKKVGDHECIHCGKCGEVCPTKAISYKAGSATLYSYESEQDPEKKKRRQKKERLLWAAALCVLFAALVYFNMPDAAPEQGATAGMESDILTGYEIGMLAPDFTVPLYGKDGTSFTLSEHRGKTVIVNFWATWCTPCCAELPHFEELYREKNDELVIVAVHSNLITDDVAEYLSAYDYSFPFALDENGDVIKSYNGSTMLPHTVVVDKDGVITYNAVGSVTYEKLLKLFDDASQ